MAPFDIRLPVSDYYNVFDLLNVKNVVTSKFRLGVTRRANLHDR